MSGGRGKLVMGGGQVLYFIFSEKNPVITCMYLV